MSLTTASQEVIVDTDYLDRLIAAAPDQGWHVSQLASGTWMFQQGTVRVMQQVDTARAIW